MFSIPNLLTAGNLISGIAAIILALSGYVHYAPFAIFLGLIFDFFDGFAARMLRKSGELGKQLDSLADMITFGVAPGIIMLVFMVTFMFWDGGLLIQRSGHFAWWMRNLVHPDDLIRYLPLTALLIPFFALFRLAKFNIDTRQSESFIGLPTPACTLFFMVFPLSLNFIGDAEWSPWFDVLFNPWFISVLIVVMSILMVVELPLFSLKFKQFKFRGNEIRYSFLLISLIFILVFRVWSIALIVFLYLILSLVENTFFKKKENEV